MSTSKIEWTEATWNPTVGCSRVSPGCGTPGGGNCYAIGLAHRGLTAAHRGLTIRQPGEKPDWTGEVRCLPERLDQPLRWSRPRMIFVDSMSDLFHEQVPPEFIARVFGTMSLTERHTYQILTKRPQRMRNLLTGGFPTEAPEKPSGEWPLRNVWLGTSIESGRYSWRADHLRATAAAVRFLSLEPLLEPLPSLDLTSIDWVIVGGESGPGARPMHPDWVRSIRDRCTAAGIPFFFKQWGEWAPSRGSGGTVSNSQLSRDRFQYETVHLTPQGEHYDNSSLDLWLRGTSLLRVGKKRAGRDLDGRTWDQMPEVTGA